MFRFDVPSSLLRTLSFLFPTLDFGLWTGLLKSARRRLDGVDQKELRAICPAGYQSLNPPGRSIRLVLSLGIKIIAFSSPFWASNNCCACWGVILAITLFCA